MEEQVFLTYQLSFFLVLVYSYQIILPIEGILDESYFVNSDGVIEYRKPFCSKCGSHDVIKKTGKMNVNFLTIETPFSVFEKYGFQSGKSINKFENTKVNRLDNGLVILPEYINSYMALELKQYIDLGSHGMFICLVTAAEVVSNIKAMTYEYYQNNVKPKPETKKETKGYVCTVCGYVYEGDELPSDIICPLCKHGADAFEKIEEKKNTEYKKYVCGICGCIYDEERGLPSEGIPAGTKFEDLPDNFQCEVCRVGKENFFLE